EVCEPPQRLLVMTAGADEPEEHAIEATLTAHGDHTILVLEERGMPPDPPAGYGAGVQLPIENLPRHIAGKERRERGAKERWEELFPAYQELAASVSS